MKELRASGCSTRWFMFLQLVRRLVYLVEAVHLPVTLQGGMYYRQLMSDGAMLVQTIQMGKLLCAYCSPNQCQLNR